MENLLLGGGAAGVAVSLGGFAVEFAGAAGILFAPAPNRFTMTASLREVGGIGLDEALATAGTRNEHESVYREVSARSMPTMKISLDNK